MGGAEAFEAQGSEWVAHLMAFLEQQVFPLPAVTVGHQYKLVSGLQASSLEINMHTKSMASF